MPTQSGNAAYKRVPATGTPGDWMRQDGGGPAYMKVGRNSDDGLYYTMFTYDGASWFMHINPTPDVATQQTHLDNYAAALNAGTA